MKKIIKKKYILPILLLAVAAVLWQASGSPIVIHLLRVFGTKISGQASANATMRLDVAFHRQEHALSCEAAALKMAMSAHRVEVSETEIINHLAFDPTPRSRGIWGDPDAGFVGNIDGKMMSNGYGVYWDPIAQTGSNWLSSEVVRNATAADVAAHITQGNPVIIWGYFGKGKRVVWHTPAGKRVEGVNGEHARVAIGFSGNAEDPEGFILLDPIYGEQYWPTAKLMSNWKPFNNSGVVVKPL